MPDASTSVPIQHTLQPHHVALVIVFFFMYERIDSISQSMVLQFHRVLLRAVSERSEPMIFDDLCDELEHGCTPQPPDAEEWITMLRKFPEYYDTVERMRDTLKDIPQFWTENEDDFIPSSMVKRSYFGNFLRRCYIAYMKLSFEGMVHLVRNFQAWVEGDHTAGYQEFDRTKLKNDDYLTRSVIDRTKFASAEPFAIYQKSLAVGDNHQAVENLRRFFEQKFHDQDDSELRQHAMLNLARTYYSAGKPEEARKVVLEAITVARTMDDNATLQACMSLLRRFAPTGRNLRMPLNELQADVSPLEVLNDVTKLLNANQPLSEAFEKIEQGYAVYDFYKINREARLAWSDQWAFHAMQSVVWRLAGAERLADIEDTIVLAFTPSGGSSDVRLSAVMNKSQSLARAGDYDGALTLLIDPNVWKGLESTDAQYGRWAKTVWDTLAMASSRRGQLRHFRDWFRSARPSSENAHQKKLQQYILLPPDKYNVPVGIDAALYKAIQMRHYDQAVTSVEQVLRAIWQSEFEGRYRSYRIAAPLLADVGLEFGLTEWSKRLMYEVMPQIITGNDIELRAFACLIQARCIIICSGQNHDGLRGSLMYLQQSEADYHSLDMKQAELDVQYVMSVVYHNLGMQAQRDETAARHWTTESIHKEVVSQHIPMLYVDLWRTVSEIGAALSSR